MSENKVLVQANNIRKWFPIKKWFFEKKAYVKAVDDVSFDVPAGEIVFAVEPMGDAGRHAFPVADNFKDFLRLLMACGHEAYIEQAHAWGREQYDNFAKENPVPFDEYKIADENGKTVPPNK